jgi:hypothetical protein
MQPSNASSPVKASRVALSFFPSAETTLSNVELGFDKKVKDFAV